MTQPDPLAEPHVADPSPGVSGAELAGRFRERIRLFAARRLGSVAEAEDVAQETLRRVTEALCAGRVRQAEALPGFVFQTAQHICQQHHRSAERETRGLLRLAADQQAEYAPDPLAEIIAEERCRLVHRALSRLRGDDRELLRQLYFADLAPEAVAARLDLTAGALRVRKHRALHRLAELLEELER